MRKNPLNAPFLSNRIYIFLFALLGLAYLPGLFVPLMDSDSAHHACIALRMHLTGDYASLVDHAGDYLDKPHLLFWLAAFSFKVFGVTAFAYKLPAFLFTIFGTYSVYRLGKTLYSNEVGKLAALIVASAFAYILANSDVRMDAILTACIAFASWQLAAFIQDKKMINVAGAALGLALGFSTKGHIAVFVPAVFAFFYILYRKEWKIFINVKWLLMLVLFGIFISPVVYAYYLQYNLHPEKVVRGKDHIDGVSFILFNQSVERFSGSMGGEAKNDYLFFIHSFLWAFAPWSILGYIALAGRIKNFFKRTEEWGTTAAFLIVLLTVSLSSFKLPHYLNIVFPLAAVMTAVFVLGKSGKNAWIKRILVIQYILVALLLLAGAMINAWAFPVKPVWIIAGAVLLLAVVFYFIRSTMYNRLQKAVVVPVAVMAFSFFLLNSNFYPQLLQYQGGQNLARITRGKVDPADAYVQSDTYHFSSSYTFYTASTFKIFNDSLLGKGKQVWLQAEPEQLEEFSKQYVLGKIYETTHFHVTKLTLKFLNPATREKECGKLVIVEIIAKK